MSAVSCTNFSSDDANTEEDPHDDIAELEDVTNNKENLDKNTTEEKKLWSKEATLLLINLVQENDERFQRSVKKYIWQKISNVINERLGCSYNWDQCNTKWKTLVRTYKDVLKHNNTSGKNRRYWEYWQIMHNFMHKKPEISPSATCSSNKGLILKDNHEDEENVSVDWSEESEASTSGVSFQSNFSRKRNMSNPVQRRHDEKMRRMDKYLELLERMVSVMENEKK